MTDTPGWASPGSAPSNDGREPGASSPSEPADHPDATAPQPDANQQGSGVKWSKEQPPPGQWSAPTGAPGPHQAPPPPPPGPGWGGRPTDGPSGYGGPPGSPAPGGYGGYGTPRGYGAWGGGWGGPPPAAKPGVIPLRPLGVGEILDGAVSTMRTHWRTVLGISLAVALLLNTSMVLLQGFLLNDTVVRTTLNDPNASPHEALQALRETMIGTGLIAVIRSVAVIIATALLTTITSRAVLGRPVSAGEAWREARPQIPKLFGLLILLGLIFTGVVIGGALPGLLLLLAGNSNGGTALLTLGILASAVIVVWLGIRFYLAAPALMLERQGVVKSLKRSAKLVRGSWWRTFGIVLLTLLLTGIVASVITIPFTLIGAAVGGDSTGDLLGTSGGHISWATLIVQGVGALIGATLTLPISAGVAVLLYIDQRIRREALDLELARAAGVQAAGGTGPVPGS